MLKNGNLLKWWLLVVLTAAGVVIVNYFDGIQFVYNNDLTKLSFVIAGLFLLTSAVVGYKIFTNGDGKYQSYEAEWLVSEHLLSLGLLGTVCSLAYSFYVGFQNLDIGNVESAQNVIAALSSGLSAAFMTTIVGLSLSMILKSQLVIAEGDDR